MTKKWRNVSYERRRILFLDIDVTSSGELHLFNDLLGKDAPVIGGLKGLLPCYRPGDGLRRKAASPSGQSEQHAHKTQKIFPHTRPPACGPSL